MSSATHISRSPPRLASCLAGFLAWVFLAGPIPGAGPPLAAAGESADAGVTITQPVPFAEGPFEGAITLGAELLDAAPFQEVVPFQQAPPPVEVPGSNGFPLPAPVTPLEIVSPPEPAAPSLFQNFSGPTDPGTVIPPDTMGAVGPSHALNTLNSGVAVFDKATGTKLSETTLQGFWAPLGTGVGQPARSPVFDPKVLYDPGSGRFLFVTLGGSSSPNSWLLLAVSATSDPAGAWSRWAIDADRDGGNQTFANWADYPGLGVDDNNVYVTANMFNAPQNNFQYPKAWVVPKAQLLSSSATLTWTEFRAPFGGTSNGFSMQPAHTFGPVPTEYFVHEGYFITGTPPRRFLRLSAVTFPAGSPIWADLGFIEVNSYPITALPLAPQQNDTHLIETNDARMLNAVYRNGSLWAAHTVGNSANTRTEAAWYELNPAVAGPLSLPGTPVQQGRVSDPNRFYFFPSIAVNGFGDAGIGFSGSSPSEFAGAFFTGRGSGDPPGTTQPVATLQAGLSTYFKDFGSGSNRWGDYSGTSVDPSDDATFWTTQEFAASPANTWGIRWGAFGVASVGLTAAPPTTATVGTNVTFSGSATGGTGPFEYEFQARFPGGTFGTVRGYTTDNTWVWNTAGAPATGYEFQVNVRTVGSATVVTSPTLPYTLTTPGATGVGLSATPPTSATVGTSVTFTGSATGTGPFEYEFQARFPGGTFGTVRGYTTDNTWVWNTAGAPATGYEFQVNVRTVGSATVVTSPTLPYTLTTAGATGAGLSANPPTSATVGTSVTFTGSATGTGPFEYEFQARFPGGTFGTVRGYATDNTWVWNTAGAPATGYEFQVNVRTVGSTTVVTSPTLPYTLTTPGATGAGLSANPPTSTTVGTSVTFTGSATGTGPFEYEFQARFPGGTFGTVRGYATDNTWVWNTAGAPATGYEFQVNARTVGSATVVTSPTLPYTLTTPGATGAGLSANPPTSTTVGTTVTFTGSATGTGPFEYEFQARFPGGTFGHRAGLRDGQHVGVEHRGCSGDGVRVPGERAEGGQHHGRDVAHAAVHAQLTRHRQVYPQRGPSGTPPHSSHIAPSVIPIPRRPTCPRQICPCRVNAFQNDSRRRVNPPGFEARWVFYFQKKQLKTCVQIVTTRIHVHSQSFTTYQKH